MMQNPVEKVWESYRHDVVPADAGRAQIVETQRAFYAGAIGVVGILLDATDGPDVAARLRAVFMELGAVRQALNADPLSWPPP